MDHAGEEIAYRCVQLVTGETVMVDADNWYFPDRLTSDMRRELETAEIPFGRVIAALRPRRRTFLVKRCALTELEAAHEDLESHRRGPGSTRLDHVFEHRALIHLDSGRPLAVVHERYRAALVCEHLR
jgi:chorismate-pyruvate lyase